MQFPPLPIIATLLLLFGLFPREAAATSTVVQEASRSSGLPVEFLLEVGWGTRVLRHDGDPNSPLSLLNDLGQLHETEEEARDPKLRASVDAYLGELAKAYASSGIVNRVSKKADPSTRKIQFSGALFEHAVTRACTQSAARYPVAEFRLALEDRVWLMEQVQRQTLDLPQTGRFSSILAKAARPPKVPEAFQQKRARRSRTPILIFTSSAGARERRSVARR